MIQDVSTSNQAKHVLNALPKGACFDLIWPARTVTTGSVNANHEINCQNLNYTNQEPASFLRVSYLETSCGDLHNRATVYDVQLAKILDSFANCTFFCATIFGSVFWWRHFNCPFTCTLTNDLFFFVSFTAGLLFRKLYFLYESYT